MSGFSLQYSHFHCNDNFFIFTPQEEEDYSEVMQDPEFLQSVLENLPGVDPNSEAIKDAMKTLTSDTPKDGKDKDPSKKEGKK